MAKSNYTITTSRNLYINLVQVINNEQIFNGLIELFSYLIDIDSNRNSVLYLDYNASDEYIASVFENGSINIYGHRTKTKMDSFNIDSK